MERTPVAAATALACHGSPAGGSGATLSVPLTFSVYTVASVVMGNAAPACVPLV